MKFIIDDADVKLLKTYMSIFLWEGVTTNPSILAKSKRPPYEVLGEIREFIGKDADLHVQLSQRVPKIWSQKQKKCKNDLERIHILKSPLQGKD